MSICIYINSNLRYYIVQRTTIYFHKPSCLIIHTYVSTIHCQSSRLPTYLCTYAMHACPLDFHYSFKLPTHFPRSPIRLSWIPTLAYGGTCRCTASFYLGWEKMGRDRGEHVNNQTAFLLYYLCISIYLCSKYSSKATPFFSFFFFFFPPSLNNLVTTIKCRGYMYSLAFKS